MLTAALILGIVIAQGPPAGDAPAPYEAAPVAQSALPLSLTPDTRIFGVIPAYEFVEKPGARLPPMTPSQKLDLFEKETLDPFTFFGAAMGATISHIQQSSPKYGEGGRAYRQRLGAAYIDMATQNFFSDALLATVFKEDPRYYRLGPAFGFFHRVGYSLSRVAITRTDSGKTSFNFASVLGTGMGIGLSNAYYPAANHNGSEMASRVGTSFASAAVGNLLPEFWPDIKQKLARRRKAKF